MESLRCDRVSDRASSRVRCEGPCWWADATDLVPYVSVQIRNNEFALYRGSHSDFVFCDATFEVDTKFYGRTSIFPDFENH
jgi:hypothetical protein